MTLPLSERLTLGVWGSFTTPRSRGQRGRCEMTRAAPLVFKPPSINIFQIKHTGWCLPGANPSIQGLPR
ncbi:hypothetical protein PSYTB_29195 (plasmid) [Pseudomonas amygdali pv. tabaci str. ATCC 11528]|nr:hypothetical protein PSYTB_29195 [Pseudomonas amygdali pv. tabaci str. ATCC 11528]